MTSFIELHTTSGMQELVNVSTIQSVKQMKKFTQVVFTDEEPLEVVEPYEEVKAMIRRAEESTSAATR